MSFPFDNADLLVISRQPRTLTRKRADLFAVWTDGELVVIEVKRDAEEEKGRRQAMEFQAIRYGAASREMTARAVIDLSPDYLRRAEAMKVLGLSRVFCLSGERPR